MNLLHTSLILLSIVHHASLDSSSSSSSASASSKELVVSTVELVGPQNFVALGGNDLNIRYRLSSSSLSTYNITTTPFTFAFSHLPFLSFQLVWLQDDRIEQIISTQNISSSSLSYVWQEVDFECGLIVRGGYYNIRLVGIRGKGVEVEGESTTNHYDYLEAVQVISNITIKVVYPVIDFEVPHRLETYTTSVPVSFGLTRSLCKPKLPLPSTILTLSLCKQSDTEECTRNFVTILQDPLIRLQSEGQATVNIECHFWGKNSTYRVQIQETNTKLVISMSQRIKVEWSSRFAINFTVKSILPCPTTKMLRVLVSYPNCVLPEKDKIRIYGHETIVPSLLAVNRINYIEEKQIRPNRQVVSFPCSSFTPRFSRYCFQYISTAVDDSVSVVVEKCLPTLSSDELSDGGDWRPWSEWSECSSVCGSGAKQFRYRFCETPHSAFGDNFCQGNSIEERSCDTILPDCPIEEFSLSTSANEEMNPSSQFAFETSHSSGPIPIHPPLNINLSTTLGCECGCIIDDILPGSNATLVVIISSNQSSCGDQDEDDHHHLKWVLNGKLATSRILLDVVDIDLHCLSLKFRDGNTSDSNLLDVFTSSRSRPDSQKEQEEEQQSDQQKQAMTIRIESTGSSLSIAASESNQNDDNDCALQIPFLYLVAYYQATTAHTDAVIIQEEGTNSHNGIVYEFWTFLMVKLVLSMFVIIVLCSMFGGVGTKVYHKYKYKQLKWSENEFGDDEACGGDGIVGVGDNASRCTSVTLMSFDYSYWKRMRILRLKYFLLRPKKLNTKIANVKSYPTTPTHLAGGGKQRSKLCRNKEGTIAVNGKHVSLSETNLCEKIIQESFCDDIVIPTSLTQAASTSCKSFDNKDVIMTEKSSKERHILCEDHNEEQVEHLKCGGPIGKYKIATCSSSSQNKGRPAVISITVPTEETEGTKNEKLRKEKENLKRRQSSELMERKSKNLVKKLQMQNGYNRQQHGGEEVAMKVMLKKDNKGKSQISVSTIHSVAKLSSSYDTDSTDRADLEQEEEEEDDADQDFAMDYYDYDVENVGKIPGSYLGLKPNFVLWNSEYPYDDDDEDHPHRVEEGGEQDNDDSTSSSFGGLAQDSMERDECSTISMTESRNNSKFRLHHPHQPQLHTKETSLHTLKFVDDEDDEDDDDNTQASDSLFDHENY